MLIDMMIHWTTKQTELRWSEFVWYHALHLSYLCFGST